MHDTIDDRGGHVSVAEHLAPPSELQVRGEHHAPLLVGIRDDLEQESGPVDVDGQIAQLVDDQQPGAPYRAQFRVEPVLVPRAPQTHHQRRRGEEPHRHAPLARQHARGDRHVRLAASDIAVEHEVLGPVHETEVHELLAPPVGGERRHAPVVSVEALDAREPRAPDQSGASGFHPAGVLGPEQVGQHAELAGRGVRDHGTQHAPGQRQAACESHDLVRGGFAHGPAAPAPARRGVRRLTHHGPPS